MDKKISERDYFYLWIGSQFLVDCSKGPILYV